MKAAAEIRDPVHGYIYLNEVEKEVIDAPVFQRLRRIRQLAGAHLTYPGGQHSRFEHLVGSMHLAGLAGASLAEKLPLSEDEIEELKLAALLHDIGHGPFSHLFEEVMNEKRGITHEDVTVRVLKETILKNILEKYGFDSKNFAEFTVGRSLKKKRFLNDVIGGVLSVDVMDYLLRDSYFTGVEYGRVDAHRIISSYEVVDDHLALDLAALYAFEALMIARYEMFKAVYFHRTVRAAEIMLIEALSLADEVLNLTDVEDLDHYLSLTDEAVLDMLVKLDPKGDRRLEKAKRLAIEYRDRRLLKCAFERIVHRRNRFMERIFSQKGIRDEIEEAIAKEAGVDPDVVYVDVPTAPSLPFTSKREALTSMTFVSKTIEERRIQTISLNEMPLLNAITGFLDLLRVYTTVENRLKVEEAAERYFGGESFVTKISM